MPIVRWSLSVAPTIVFCVSIGVSALLFGDDIGIETPVVRLQQTPDETQSAKRPVSNSEVSQSEIRTRTAILVDGKTRMPLPGIDVEVRKSQEGHLEPQVTTLTSEDAGQVTIPFASGTATKMQVTSPGWWQSGWTFVGDMPDMKTSNGEPVTTDAAKPVTIAIWKGTIVTGQLRKPDGTPAAEVTLNVGVYIHSEDWKERLGMEHGTFNSWDHGDWPNWRSSVVTHGDGSFSITVPPPDARSWVRVGTTGLGFGSISPIGLGREEKRGPLAEYAPFECEIPQFSGPTPVENDNRRDFGVLQLQNGIVLKGRVVDAQGNPLAGIHLLTSGQHGPHAGRSAESSQDGSFEFLPMNPGTFTLEPDARKRDETGKIVSRDVQAVFVKQEVAIPESSNSVELIVQAVPHVDIEFEWVDRRAKKGPVSYYGEFNITGLVPRPNASPAWWRGSTEMIERDGKQYLVVKTPRTITNPRLYLPADQRVTASYEDDQTKSGPGQLALGDITKPMRRVIYGDEP
jgi:hypothetical protein